MKRVFIFLSLILIIYSTCYSQTDTIAIVKADSVSAPEKQDRMYKFFVESKETDIRHLWKVNLTDVGLERANVTYEQRMGKLWSTEGYLSYGYNWIKPFSSEFWPMHGHDYSLSQQSGPETGTSLEIEQLFKFYYNLNKRERLGKRTNGFSGNYLATSILFNNINNPSNLDRNDDFAVFGRNINLGIKYGVQRKIGNLGYVEVYAGLYYRWEWVRLDPANEGAAQWTYRDNYPVFKVGIKVGFAIDTFDNLRKMIKK